MWYYNTTLEISAANTYATGYLHTYGTELPYL